MKRWFVELLELLERLELLELLEMLERPYLRLCENGNSVAGNLLHSSFFIIIIVIYLKRTIHFNLHSCQCDGVSLRLMFNCSTYAVWPDFKNHYESHQ